MCPDATERGGSLAAVFRTIKKKDGTTAVRIDKDKALAEAAKVSRARNDSPRNDTKAAKQSAGSATAKKGKKV